MVLGQVSISQRHGHGCVSKQFLNILEAAAIAKKAHETGKTIREVALEEKILPKDALDRLLSGSG
ncbi:MAG: hypothetical protein CL941_01755 [Desulfobacter sp.]|jgi:aspartate ammonia-lyase|nr:hypothetical protein [Desulfobacter sp.]